MSVPAGLVVGCTVHIDKQGLDGLVHYVGPTKFGKDPTSIWVGIELKVAKGKHNGTLKGEKYFSCPPLHGMFARVSAVKVIAPPAEKKEKVEVEKKPEAPKETAKKPTAVAAPVRVNADPVPKAAAVPKTDSVGGGGGTNNAALERELAQAKAEIADLKEQVEIAELDRDMAVEEGKDQRDQVMDLQDRLRSQPVGGGSQPEATATDATATPNETAKLKEALIQLRDAWVLCQDELEVTKMELNEDRRELNQMKSKFQSSSSALAKAQQNVLGMSSQISGAADSEQMIEFLTNKTQELENQKKDLLDELQDMTQICALSDEVAEAYQQSENDTSLDLDAANETILEMNDVIQSLQNQNVEYRKAVPKLRSQISEFQRKAEQDEEESGAGLAKRDQEEKERDAKQIYELQTKLASGLKKERSQSVDQELNSLEQKQAASNLTMIKNFLPDSFFNVEYAGIELVLFLDRIAMKCDVVSSDTIDQYKLNKDIAGLLESEASEGITIEMTSFAHDVIGIVASIKSTVANIASSLGCSDDATYRGLSTKYLDVQGHESCIDNIIDCIKADKLGPQFSLEKMKQASRQFDHLGKVVGDQNDALAFATDVINSIDLFNKALAIELTRLSVMFSRTSSEGERDVAFDDIVAQITAWTGHCNDIEKFCRKAKSKLVSPDETKALKFDESIRAHLATTLADVRGLADGVRSICKAVWDHTHSSATLKALPLEKAMKIAISCRIDLSDAGTATESAKQARAEDSMIPLHAKHAVTGVLETLKKLYDSLEHGAYDVDKKASDAATVTPPWEQRGTHMKAEIAESLGYKSKLEESKKEILEEKKKTMAKQRKIDELDVKIQGKIKETNTYKSQLQNNNQQTDGKVKDLSEELIRLKQEFEMERTNADDEIKDLDKEIRSLKKKYEGRAGAMAGITDMRGASIQIHTLKEAVRMVKVELAQARGAASRKLLQGLPKLVSKPASDKDKKVVGDVSKMLLDLKLAAAAPLIVDISKKPAVERVTTKKPLLQMSTQAARLHALCTRGTKVADAASELISVSKGAKANVSFGNFTTPSFTRALREDVSGYRAAVITVPKLFASSGPAVRKLSVLQPQLKSIHTEFMR